jgi:hypothetical protein
MFLILLLGSFFFQTEFWKVSFSWENPVWEWIIETEDTREIEELVHTLKQSVREEESLYRDIITNIVSQNVPYDSRMNGLWDKYPNLGGIQIEKNNELVYQYGDFSDFYQDGWKPTAWGDFTNLQEFQTNDMRIRFFIRYNPGTPPIILETTHLGLRYFFFSGDGMLRRTNDPSQDYGLRLAQIKPILKSYQSRNYRLLISDDIKGYKLYLLLPQGKWVEDLAPLFRGLFLLTAIILFFFAITSLFSKNTWKGKAS